MVRPGKQIATIPLDNPPEEVLPPSYEDIQNAANAIASSTANATDDGRISVNLDSKVVRAFTKLIPLEDEPDIPALPPDYSLHPPWTLPLNIVVQVVGSRGDVQPFVALGTELQKSGHKVRIATHAVFKDFVQSAGLKFYPIGGDPAELMAYMVKNPGLIPNMNSLRKGDIRRKRRMIAEMLQGCWKSCIEPDPDDNIPFVANAIIANPVSFAHIHCAEALSIPLHLVFTMPWSPTRAFPHPLANIQNTSTDPRLANYLSYSLVSMLTWQGLGDVINRFRTSLDLLPLPLTEAPFILETLKIPTTYVWSPALVPKPNDWPSHIDVAGFIFRTQSTYNYTPPESLTTFLNAGPSPIYIGFGSIVVDDPTTLLTTILAAVKQTGVRAIVSKGWSDLSLSASISNTDSTHTAEPEQDPNILYLDDCPHEYLFPLVTATIHHGGAGTTAASLLAAKPTLVIPFFGDQPFWGERIAAAGAGPSPIPHKELTTENLVSAITVLLSPEAKNAAERIAETMRQENGVKNTVDSFHRHLDLQRLACDILPNKPAVYELPLPSGSTFKDKLKFKSTSPSPSLIPSNAQYKPQTLKLSSTATEILLKHDLIKHKHLTLYSPNKFTIENRRWDPLTSASASAVRMSMQTLKGVNNIWYEPLKLSMEARETRRLQREQQRRQLEEMGESENGDGDGQGKGNNNDDDRTAAEAAPSKLLMASALSLPRLTGTLAKSYAIDMPYAVAEGFRNLPKLYGEDVPPHAPVTDFKSGAIVGSKEVARGLATGLVDIFVQPYKGAKEDGVGGFVKGTGKGVLGTFAKLGGAGMAIWAYPVQGAWMSVYDALHGETRRRVFSARRVHDAWVDRRERERDDVNEREVIERFDRLQMQTI